MNARDTAVNILEGESFIFRFRHTRIISMPDENVLMEYDSNTCTTLRFKPQIGTGVLSLDFADFNTIKSFGIFDNLHNGFDFIMRRTEWIPYVYENIKDPNNPLYGLNYKINQMGFDTLCIFCHNDKVFLQIRCFSPKGHFCLDFTENV